MGFVEDLRRRQEEQEKKIQRKIGKESSKIEEWLKRESELQARKEAANIFRKKSIIPQLCKELILLRAVKEWRELDKFYGYEGMPELKDDSVFIEVSLGGQKWKGFKNGREAYEEKVAIVEFCYDGSVIFHGSSSNRLSSGRWLGNRDVQEKALGSAYRNPRKIRYTSNGGGHPIEGT